MLLAPDAEAQFNARGRGRRAPTSTKARPRAPAPTPKRAPRGRETSPPPRTVSAPRDDVLLARYRRLIFENPGEEVPLARLAELTRKKDGDLTQLLRFVASRKKDGQYAYETLVAWAGLLALDHQPASAIEKLTRAQALGAKRPEALLMLGKLQREQGKSSEARSALHKARPLLSGPKRTETIRILRDLSLELGEFTDASNYHDDLVREAKGNLYLRGELGRELLRRGETERAINAQKRALKRAGQSSRARAVAFKDLGEAQLEGGKIKASIDSLERASKLSVGEPGRRLAIDQKLATAHQQAGSLQDFLTRLRKTAQSGVRLGFLARLLEENGQTEEAIVAYRKALRTDPRNIDLKLQLVRLLELTGDLEGAVDQYAALVKNAPGDVQLSMRFMEMLLAQGHRERVKREWDRIEALSRSDHEAGLLLVDFAERLGEPARATLVLKRLAQSGGDARMLVELGSRFFRAGDEKKARSIWSKIPNAHRNKAKGQTLLGEVLLDHGATKDGLASLRVGVSLAPQSLSSRKALALGLERAATQGTGGRARAARTEALAIWLKVLDEPQDPTTQNTHSLARRHIIRLWKHFGTLSVQLARLHKKLNATPVDLDAGRLLVEGLIKVGDLATAETSLKKILSHAPGDRSVLLQLEKLYGKQGKPAEAISILQKLVRSDPARAREYFERMARAATRQGDEKQALVFAEQAVARSPGDPNAQAALGDLYFEQGRLKAAESAYARALKVDDRQHRVAFQLAELYEKTDRANDALELLVRVLRTARDSAQISRASRRALALGLAHGRGRDLEDVLRPLSVSHPDQPLYRALLLEVLSAQMYPLVQAANYAASDAKARAIDELKNLSSRSTQPLLAALAGGTSTEQRTAIQLLSFGATTSSGNALLAFAESSTNETLRVQAVVGAGKIPHSSLQARLIPFFQKDGRFLRGRTAEAALWVSARHHNSETQERLLQAASDAGPQLRTLAFLGLAAREHLSRAHRLSVSEIAIETLENPAKGQTTRAAAAIALAGVRHGAPDRTSISALLVASQDRESLVAQAALIGLGSLCGSEQTTKLDPGLVREVHQTLSGFLFHPEVALRKSAELGALSLVASDSRSIAPTLKARHESAEELLQSAMHEDRSKPEPTVRHRAILALGDELSTAAALAIRTSQAHALTVLHSLSSNGQIPRLGRLLVPSDPATEKATQARALVKRIKSELLPVLTVLARGHNADLRVAAYRLLALADDSTLLADGLVHEDSRTFQAALFSLSNTSGREALSVVVEALNNEGRWARRRRMLKTLLLMWRRTDNDELRSEIEERVQEATKAKEPLVAAEAHDLLKQMKEAPASESSSEVDAP